MSVFVAQAFEPVLQGTQARKPVPRAEKPDRLAGFMYESN
ncbi:hypothetical protein FTUN_4003 [Frigoriglobus tundricola]|uniref:Uncharacterized protein n=1 Tax=Frigoriglobus tundricola TaxID=2774151 RepID=A0A6M5YSQ8_9BACT|nr:hypothetical protein FTUN_4003 [Frigoriglobus tundricola]